MGNRSTLLERAFILFSAIRKRKLEWFTCAQAHELWEQLDDTALSERTIRRMLADAETAGIAESRPVLREVGGYGKEYRLKD